MSIDSFKTQQQEWRAAGRCIQCGGEPIPGQRMCAIHREKARERNRRYEARLRATGRKKPQRIVSIVAAERRHREECALVAFAAREGRVPTLAECCEIMGHGWPTSTWVQDRRRGAFGLRKLTKREVRVSIPFPVPTEYLANAAAVAS